MISTEQPDDRSGDGSHDEQEHHHRHRPVLIFVIKRRAKEPVTGDGFRKTARFFEFRCWAPWNPFAIPYIATHGSIEEGEGHSPYEAPSFHKPYSPLASKPRYATV